MGLTHQYCFTNNNNYTMVKTLLLALLTFISLLNPIQKIFVISTLRENYDDAAVRQIVNRSTRTAAIVLILFLVLGNELLSYVFNIEIYSFQIICGIVLCINGLTALQKGLYVNIDDKSSIESIVTVPIAVPMIAGPATITAVVTMPSLYGFAISFGAVTLGLLLNWVVMRKSDVIARAMNRHNLLNPSSRIIGLIVAAIGVQMILNGVGAYVATLS